MHTLRVTPLSLTVLAVLALCRPGHATTINVPGDQPTIQAGIDAAVNGDMVLVAPGTYNEAINFNGKAITLQSSGGADLTTINAQGLNTSVVKFVSGETLQSVLQGFTVTGGTGLDPPGGGGFRHGGGIYIGSNPNSSATIIECRIVENVAIGTFLGTGGGISHGFGSLILIDCLIENNRAEATSGDGTGGGLTVAGNALLIQCRFQGNIAKGSFGSGVMTSKHGRGGGVYDTSPSTSLLALNCAFLDNQAFHTGGTGGGWGCWRVH